ncbi:MAG: response regulator transcription factor [Chloroflexota bacterium]|nr:response regulator transcription factor [Chloroflexota bacterium]
MPGHDIWLNVSILPVSDGSGGGVGLAHIVHNINRPKRLEQYVQELATSAAEVLAVQAGNHVQTVPAPAYLTVRELVVLRLLAHGADTAGIADTLGISRHTAHNHVAAVLSKLGVHSRIEAAAFAFEHHLT